MKQIGKLKPDYVVHLGDLFDLKCLSRFDKSGASTLKAEYESGNQFVQQINDAAPKAKRVFLMGNHEHRAFNESHQFIAEVIDPKKHVSGLRGWAVLPYRYHPDSVFRLGQVTFAHGFSTSTGQLKQEALLLGCPNGLYVHGHLHKGHGPQQIVAGSLTLPYWIADAGCGIRSDEPYFQTFRTDNWSRGLIHGWADTKAYADNMCHWDAEYLEQSRFWA